MSHKDRMTDLDRWMIPSEKGYSNAHRKALWTGLSAEEQAHAKRRAKRAREFAWAQHKSGANQLADKTLRTFVFEYNSRIARHGLIEYDLPGSFEFIEAFVEYVPHLFNFRICPERDYQIDSSDFLEYVTSDEAPSDVMSAAYEFDDGETYNVTSVTDPHNTLMATDTDTVGFGAASIVRRGDEVVVLLVCGTKEPPVNLPEEEWLDSNFAKPWLREIAEEAASQAAFNKWFMLYGDLYKQTVLVRYDLSRRTVLDRAIGWESEAHWQWISDQRTVARDLPTEKLRDMIAALEEHRATFRLAESTLLLASYLRKRYEVTTTKKIATELGRNATIQSKKKPAPTKGRVLYRLLRSLVVKREQGSPSAVGRSYTRPQFQVEVEGFWRRLSNPETIGKDSAGNPVKGKTWVKEHLRYRENPPLSDVRIVFIKQTLRSARAQAFGLKLKPAVDSVPAPGIGTRQGISYLYVMTNPALKSDLWKIGYTDGDPEERARQLSSSTGVPVSYLVVESWGVTDGALAESAAHAALEDYRVTTRREFFQGRYALLRETLLKAIEPWAVR